MSARNPKFAAGVIPPACKWKMDRKRFVKVVDTGPKGVTWLPDQHCWVAYHGGYKPQKSRHFRTLKEAVAQRNIWEAARNGEHAILAADNSRVSSDPHIPLCGVVEAPALSHGMGPEGFEGGNAAQLQHECGDTL